MAMINILAIACGGALGSVLRHLINTGLMSATHAPFPVGVLGGFTTFSAFSLDAVMLWERGAVMQSIFYVTGSVLFSIAALAMGLLMVRMFSA